MVLCIMYKTDRSQVKFSQMAKKGKTMKKTMKNNLSALLIAAMTVACISIGAVKATADVAEKGFVSVSTTANTELPPDVVEINIAVQTDDVKSLQKATEENKLISDKVYSSLSSKIKKENGDYIKTANYNAYPVYNYKNEKKTLVKYEVSNNIIVHTKEIKDAGKIIDKAISLGATNVNNLTFSVSSYDAQCNDLLGIAAKKAYSRAAVMATSAGNSLAGIKSMSGSCSTTSATPVRLYASNKSYAMDSVASAEASGSSPIQGGVVKLYASLNASYYVK